jgi:Uncharacterized protein conserved in bacteria (DUF2334)
MDFCIRDDDTSFFTSPDELESVYGEINRWGPISLAIVPFCRAGRSKGIPERYKEQWSVHPLHENPAIVSYLREGLAKGRYEAMLHGYYHDEPNGHEEFERGGDLERRVADGRKYLEDVLSTQVRVFVPPRNSIGRQGLRAIARAGLHLGGVAGIRRGWRLPAEATWKTWLRLRRWKHDGGTGIPWVLDLGDHREIAGNPVTPTASLQKNRAAFDAALESDGVFCAATHYWEVGMPSLSESEPSVREHLRWLATQARNHPRVVWRSVGDVLSGK